MHANHFPTFSPPRLRALREASGQTITAFAARLGLSASTVAAYEKGHRDPGTRALAAMAAALHVTVSDFFVLDDAEAVSSR